MPVILKNNAFSTLATGITTSDTGIVVANGSQFPTITAGEYFYATLVSPAGTTEIVKVTARVSNSLTVVRAQDGSSAASFQVGALVEMRANAASVTDLVDEHDQASEISIADAGGYYTSGVVEGALQEVGADLRTQAAQTRDTVTALLADTTLTYTAGQVGTVATGDIVRTREEGFAYKVAAPGATDNHVTTAGGVKLYVLPSEGGVSVKAFGAVGDGVTDDYDALKAAADYINAAGGGMLYFPPGNYYVDRFISAGNGVVDPLTFIDCDGLAVLGYGAKINLKGDYYRDAASTRGLSGVVVRNCRNVLIGGFELDGNVDQTTTAGGLGEPATYGVYILSCERVSVEDVWSHHFINDGTGIRDDGVQTNPRIASKYVTFNNVKSTYNGRQGLSLVQARYCTFTNCDFSFNGRTTINFSPSAGVDIEPNRNINTLAPNQMDVDTGECHFINCLFSENNGSQFVSGEDFNTDGVRLDGCQIFTGTGSGGGTDTFIFQVVRGSVENCVFDTGGGTTGRQIFFGITPSAIATCIVSNCTFYLRSAGNKIVDNQSASAKFINNRILVLGTTPHAGVQQYIASNNTNSEWIDNYFWAAKEIYVDGGSGDRHIILSYAPRSSRNNRFETDLLASAGDGGTAHFANGYGAATISDGDVYVGTAPGTADTFRPTFNSVFNTNLPYSKSLPGFASVTYDPPSLLTGTSATTTIPVTGAALGDFVTASFQRDLLGITLFAWVSAAGTVSVQFRNDTGVTRDLGSSTLRVQVTPVPR